MTPGLPPLGSPGRGRVPGSGSAPAAFQHQLPAKRCPGPAASPSREACRARCCSRLPGELAVLAPPRCPQHRPWAPASPRKCRGPRSCARRASDCCQRQSAGGAGAVQLQTRRRPRSSSSPDASALQLPTPRGAAGRDWDLLRWPPARTATPCRDAKGAVPGRYSGSGGKC